MDGPRPPQPVTLERLDALQAAAPTTNALSGPLGLRAGWGILLFFLLSLVFGTLLFAALFRGTGHMATFQQEARTAQQAKATAARTHQPAEVYAAPGSTLLMEAVQAGAVLLAAGVVALPERRRFGVYGLPLRRIGQLLPGALVGLAAIALLVGLLRVLGVLVFDRQLLHGHAALRYGAEWALTFVLVGLFEEFFFRGYLQFTLMRGLLRVGVMLTPADAQRGAFWLAALVWSVLFSVTHIFNADETVVGVLMVFVAGAVFSYALWRTGSLWWGVGFHATWDWGQSFLFGVPDSGNLSLGRLFATHPTGRTLLSGGAAGPEGSVLAIPVLLLVAVALRLHRQGTHPPVEPSSLPLLGSGSRTAFPSGDIP